jgi:hypothetical protein
VLDNLSLQLLQDAFGDQWERAHVEWWRFGADGKVIPETHKWAPAMFADPGREDAVYYCVSLLKPGSKRSNENVERVFVMTLDDVGTKIVPDEGEDVPEPSWVLETSPGNWQWQYMIDGGMVAQEYTAMRAKMRATGNWWAKSEATAPANLVRLPMGVNGKPGIIHNVWGRRS